MLAELATGDDLQSARCEVDFGRRLANEFAVGVNVGRLFRSHNSYFAQPNKKSDSNQRMTNAEAKRRAKKLGYDREEKDPPLKKGAHGNKVFTNGTNFITADRDVHSGGAWKMFDSSWNRIGTYDIDLNRIGK